MAWDLQYQTYGGTEPQIPVPYPFPTSWKGGHEYTEMYNGKPKVKIDGAKNSDTLPLPYLPKGGVWM